MACNPLVVARLLSRSNSRILRLADLEDARPLVALRKKGGFLVSEIEYDDVDWESCWQCHGDGGWHDCGEDCCMCLDKERVTVVCDECKGVGELLTPPQPPTNPSWPAGDQKLGPG